MVALVLFQIWCTSTQTKERETFSLTKCGGHSSNENKMAYMGVQMVNSKPKVTKQVGIFKPKQMSQISTQMTNRSKKSKDEVIDKKDRLL